jgi:hypothetical protein
VISSFCCDVNDIYGLLGFYAAWSANSTLTFWDTLSVPSDGLTLEDHKDRLSQNVVMGYISMLCKIIEQYKSYSLFTTYYIFKLIKIVSSQQNVIILNAFFEIVTSARIITVHLVF